MVRRDYVTVILCIYRISLQTLASYCRPASQHKLDAAYCYRPSSVVCRSVGLYATIVRRAKMSKPIDMPFRLRTRVGLRKYVLDGGPDPHKGMDNFEEGGPL